MSSSTWALLHQYVPQRLLGRFIGWISRSQVTWIKTPLIRWFARSNGIDLSDAVIADIGDYESLNAFFTRALKPGARRVDTESESIVSPVDGTITQFGRISAGRLIQAKGFEYELEDLLAESPVGSSSLADGEFATMYLAPHNYHRVHMPLAGRLLRSRYLAGRRFLVNAQTAGRIPRLFCRNERLVCWFDSPHGIFVLILVGALNVASISTAAHGLIAGGRDRDYVEAVPRAFSKGDEFGRFNLGSTVILLLEQGLGRFAEHLTSGQSIRYGDRIGSLARDPLARP